MNSRMSRFITQRFLLRTAFIQSGIGIKWQPTWLNLEADYDVAHIAIESITPERAPLPITETGYRSHFTSREIVAAYGGVVAFVETWLNEESKTSEWQNTAEISRQLSLF